MIYKLATTATGLDIYERQPDARRTHFFESGGRSFALEPTSQSDRIALWAADEDGDYHVQRCITLEEAESLGYGGQDASD